MRRKKDRGHNAPGFHDYPVWRARWTKILAQVPGVTVEPADRWPSAEQWRTADAVAFFHDNPAWEAAKAADLDTFLARGGGVTFLHWSVNCYRDAAPLAARLGRVWAAGSKPRAGAVRLKYRPHEITAGFPGSDAGVDETYWNLTGDGAGTVTLATSDEEGTPQPQV